MIVSMVSHMLIGIGYSTQTRFKVNFSAIILVQFRIAQCKNATYLRKRICIYKNKLQNRTRIE